MNTTTQQMISAINDSETLEKILIDNADEALYFYSMEGQLIYVSPAFENITGYTPQELHENNFLPFVHPDDQEWTMKLWEGLSKGIFFEDAEYRIVKKSGDIRWSLSSWKIVLDEHGNEIGIQGKQTDITKRKQAEEALVAAGKLAEVIARTDELTGLSNRRSFFELGNSILSLARRYNHSLSIVMMDIDHFKTINDTNSHSVGDSVLKGMAAILQNTMREVDIVARLGGDEFAFIMPETKLDGAVTLVERLRQNIAMTTFEADNERRIHITASFGVCSCPVNNETLETLLSKADNAMYGAKKGGRNQIGIYS